MRPARVALAAAAAGVCLLAASGAQAEDPDSLRSEADRLRSANAASAARSQSALLDLYALESRLGQAEERLSALRRDAAAVERRKASASARLELVRGTLREAESRLAERLRELYVAGDPDPLAVLLGAESLEGAIAALEGLGSLAQQDRRILVQVKEARTALKGALRALAARESELRDLIARAERARAALAAARAERSGYLARLARERRWNRAKIARLAARAAEIEARAEELRPIEKEGRANPPPAAPGRQLTVVATGYSLRGNTATGVPVGWGVVAVDPSVIPLGTRMTIPGYGQGTAADTGPGVRGAMIDLWFPTRAQALAWGRRTVTITLH